MVANLVMKSYFDHGYGKYSVIYIHFKFMHCTVTVHTGIFTVCAVSIWLAHYKKHIKYRS